MASKKLILLTNDDGYFSDGINALFKELSRNARVMIVAPDREQSASSHSLTMNRPLRMHKVDPHRYAIDGTPTDCVMMAVHMLFGKQKPDMIVSGINHGSNMGDDVTYSGTVAATIEGSILGIPSVAMSMADWEPGMTMARAAKWAAKFLNSYPSLQLAPSVFLNINFPPDNSETYANFEFTKLGVRRYRDIVIRKQDPRGKPYYWIAGKPTWKRLKGSDFEAVGRRMISITPLKLNFTDRDSLGKLRESDFRIKR
ncbi:MAG: 5'/3'-nucleotidase SurE [candidate division Zixibacteria bacterium]